MPGTIFAPGPGSFPRGTHAQPNQPAFLTMIAIETLVKDYTPISQVTVPSKIRIIPGIREVWEMYRSFGQYLVAMMNVSAIGRGEVNDAFVREYANNLNRKLNGTLDAVVWCPHDTESENPLISSCNCHIPKYYGLAIQAHFIVEQAFRVPFLVAYQTIVGGEGYDEMAKDGNFNYVSTDEIMKDAITKVGDSLKSMQPSRILQMSPRHE